MASTVTRSIWAAMSALGSALFRLNTGVAWMSGGGSPYRDDKGNMVIPNPRPVSVGLTKLDGKPLNGASDLLGFTRITITPAMVGHVLPIFTGIEIKEGSGRASASQNEFIGVVMSAGGIAGVARSPEDGEQIYKKFFLRFCEKKE